MYLKTEKSVDFASKFEISARNNEILCGCKPIFSSFSCITYILVIVIFNYEHSFFLNCGVVRGMVRGLSPNYFHLHPRKICPIKKFYLTSFLPLLSTTKNIFLQLLIIQYYHYVFDEFKKMEIPLPNSFFHGVII